MQIGIGERRGILDHQPRQQLDDPLGRRLQLGIGRERRDHRRRGLTHRDAQLALLQIGPRDGIARVKCHPRPRPDIAGIFFGHAHEPGHQVIDDTAKRRDEALLRHEDAFGEAIDREISDVGQ